MAKNREKILADYIYPPKKYLTDLIKEMNKAVCDKSEQLGSGRMGSTAVMLYLNHDYAYVCNVGDSRLYYISDTIEQVTKDHSVVQELIDRGEISENEAESHPNKNLITRAVGSSEEIEIDFYKFQAQKDDIIVICTDGLSNMIRKDEIKKIVTDEDNLELAVKKLVDEANNRGGFDNITVAAIRF